MTEPNQPKDLREAFDMLEAAQGTIFDLMRAVNLNPETDFRGGDWRECSFANLDVRGFNFRNSRLVAADFTGSRVALADFRGAQVWKSYLHRAIDWPDAVLDDDQREYLSKISTLQRMNVIELQERESSGEPFNVWQYVQLMKSAPDYSVAHRLYDRMTARGIEPNKHVFATLIDKANDFDLSLDLLKIAEGRAVEIDEPIYVALMSNARTFEEAKKIFEIVQRRPEVHTTYPYNTLISKSDSLADAISLVRMMWKDGPSPDRATINAALNAPWKTRRSEFATAATLVRESLGMNVVLKQADFAALLRRAKHEDDVTLGLDLLGIANLDRNIDIDNAIISIAPTFPEAMRVYEDALERGAQPDKHTYYALLRASGNHLEAFQVLARMRISELPFDIRVLDRLIAVTPDPMRSRGLRQQIEQDGSTGPADVVRGLVMIWSDDHDRKSWLDQIFPR